MMLRSSSTSALHSVIAAAESPNTSHHHHRQQPLERTLSSDGPKHHHHHHNLSLSSPNHHHHQHPFSSPLLHPPSSNSSGGGGFRRARSDGNLVGMAADFELAGESRRPGLPPRRPGKGAVLETIPSFTVRAVDPGEEEEDGDEYDEECWSVLGNRGGSDFQCSGGDGSYFALSDGEAEFGAPSLYLALGLGVESGGVRSGFFTGKVGAPGGVDGGGGGGRGGEYRARTTTGGGDRSDLEGFYRKMVEENPSDALFLRNYAQFLYQTKGDPHKAEEYYARAILADPGDGEVLSQYANLIWEVHGDQERALSYFEQAVQAAPCDSQVLAAYASFLWETEDRDADDGEDQAYNGTHIPLQAFAAASL